MKFNWGTGIFIFIILFFIALFGFVYFASKQDFDLVEKDYYPKELNWDSQLEKMKNTAGLEMPIEVIVEGDLIALRFPAMFGEVKPDGEVHIYRPSSKDLDLKYALELNDSAKQVIPAGQLVRGRYIVKIDFIHQDKPYYFEKPIFLN